MKVQRLTVETLYREYNTDKSAEHPIILDEDIVRYSLETRRVYDKEHIHNKLRTFSVAEQSTRYCDLTKDKFGGELTFIKPAWRQKDKNGFILSFDDYDAFLANCEQTYKQLRQQGWRPEQARQVLPLGLKTQAVYTAFADDWNHFLRLRADNVSGKVHPNMQLVAKKIKNIIENL